MIFNYELEQHFLASLLKHQEKYPEIAPFIGENDFYSDGTSVHQTIFCLLRNALESCDGIDHVILSERINSLGISFEDNINVSDYLKALSMRKTSPESVIKSAKELKKITVRREISETCQTVSKKMKNMSADSSYETIVSEADKLYNEQISLYDSSDNVPENLFETMEEFVEERGNNPISDFGYEGPHDRLHQIYGSLLRPGDITVIVARSGVGKTTFCLDFATKVSQKHKNVPILHFDNGEMSKEDLMCRQCASLSRVPMHLIETGNWRNAGKEVCKRVRGVWPKVRDMNLHYYNCGGDTVDSMANSIRRFYYSKVGRGNPMIFSFDYIKTTSEKAASSKGEWQIVGEMVDKFKRLIQKELSFENGPTVSMITSVQSNRYGITNNRNSSNVVDDESIVSLSDRITQFCSHMFILRQKVTEELVEDNNFGSHKLINVKARHLGQDIDGAIQPIRMEDGSLKKNFINLDFSNFGITETGDLRDLLVHRGVGDHHPDTDHDDDVPDLFRDNN